MFIKKSIGHKFEYKFVNLTESLIKRGKPFGTKHFERTFTQVLKFRKT